MIFGSESKPSSKAKALRTDAEAALMDHHYATRWSLTGVYHRAGCRDFLSSEQLVYYCLKLFMVQ